MDADCRCDAAHAGDMINTVVRYARPASVRGIRVYRFKELRLEDLNALANILGTNSTAPLAFKDPIPRDFLRALAPSRTFCGCHLRPDGEPFAVYHRGDPKINIPRRP